MENIGSKTAHISAGVLFRTVSYRSRHAQTTTIANITAHATGLPFELLHAASTTGVPPATDKDGRGFCCGSGGKLRDNGFLFFMEEESSGNG
jgi:hypothetical protein